MDVKLKQKQCIKKTCTVFRKFILSLLLIPPLVTAQPAFCSQEDKKSLSDSTENPIITYPISSDDAQQRRNQYTQRNIKKHEFSQLKTVLLSVLTASLGYLVANQIFNWKVNGLVNPSGPTGPTGPTEAPAITGATGSVESNVPSPNEMISPQAAPMTHADPTISGLTGASGIDETTESLELPPITTLEELSSQSSIGPTGLTGASGLTGATGSAGLPSITKPKESSPHPSMGPTGLTGASGLTGATGSAGLPSITKPKESSPHPCRHFQALCTG